MQKIVPCFWFDNNLEEAFKFYKSVFKDNAIINVTRVPGGPGGETVVGDMTLFGQQFKGLQGGPLFQFNESISFYVNCDSQEEVDEYWNKLTSNGGKESMCGWLKDPFGVSWQIIPTKMFKLIGDKDREKAGRAMAAMMTMKKIDLHKIEAAFNGK